jgi:hypothetical protein
MKKSVVVFLGLLLALSACNMPVGVASDPPGIAYTRAAQTVEYELTRLAPTPLPSATATLIGNVAVPTDTSTPTSMVTSTATSIPIPCNRATYNPATIDVTIPDWTTITPGATFTKTWRLTNAGTCTWTSAYQLVYHSGDAMGVASGYAQALTTGTVPPGGSIDISVNLTAPVGSGTYKGYWRLREPGGQYFGIGDANGDFYVAITVAPTVLFAVTSVTLTVSGGCGAFHITANITTNSAGTVTYKWVRSDGATDGATHPPLVFASAGMQSVSTDWSASAPGAKWMDIYIDAPNHQQFGRANFSCP